MASNDKSQRGALDGVRVIDLSRVLAGPLCTQMLSDHGADVIKIEPPSGDDTRRLGPPFDEHGDAAYFSSVNRGKRSLCLDLTQPSERAVLLEPAERRRCAGRKLPARNDEAMGTRRRHALATFSAPDLLFDHRLWRRRSARRIARLRRGAASDMRADEHQRLAAIGANAGRRADRRSSRWLQRAHRHIARAAGAGEIGNRPARRSDVVRQRAEPADSAGRQLAVLGQRAGPARQRASQHRALRQFRVEGRQPVSRSAQRSAVSTLVRADKARGSFY